MPLKVTALPSDPHLSQSTQLFDQNSIQTPMKRSDIGINSGGGNIRCQSVGSCPQNFDFNPYFANNFSFGDNRFNNQIDGMSSMSSLNEISDKNPFGVKCFDSFNQSQNAKNYPTNHLYNSCPSSPVIKRIGDKSQKSFDMDFRKSPQNQIRFHGIHGSDVVLNEDMSRVSRLEDKSFSSNCYAFVDKQLSLENEITVQIIGLDQKQVKQSFIFGVTDVNPSYLNSSDLPNDPHLLIQRSGQLWTLVDNFCDNCKLNDRLSFKIDSKGFVSFSMNCFYTSILFPIESKRRELWPFFDIIGGIKAIKIVPNFHMTPINTNIFDKNSTKHLYKCIKCFTNSANTAFYRCGHKYYCNTCAKFYLDSTKRCPICGQYIFDLVIVFP